MADSVWEMTAKALQKNGIDLLVQKLGSVKKSMLF